ncbi:uncharacterized protein F10E9.5-like [Ceratina calcarata]|uniref:Uncharacterized protein F10E9.5-like n=1 Tax=Ceratina calcarata TaxID=156304 RepID=A0AAJ7N6E2_9HYME|nr:uncharacterized protein F10E9.5-like [Ceratina calcarata]
MEFVSVKRGKNRRKRAHLKKRRREQSKLEVKFAKRQRFISEREKLTGGTMHANSFWENYTAAQEWQKRHSVIWWKTRCIALEHENQILRDKLRSVVCHGGQQSSSNIQKSRRYKNWNREQKQEEATSEEAENLEFQVNEDMMSFLEQSMRHKIELQKRRESESCTKGDEGDDTNIQGGANWVKMRNANAKLLYGEASSTILAMETALQTTIDRHKDKAKPQYWPIIPLKP